MLVGVGVCGGGGGAGVKLDQLFLSQKMAPCSQALARITECR